MQADEGSKNGVLVQVIDAARMAGVDNVSPAATPWRIERRVLRAAHSFVGKCLGLAFLLFVGNASHDSIPDLGHQRQPRAASHRFRACSSRADDAWRPRQLPDRVKPKAAAKPPHAHSWCRRRTDGADRIRGTGRRTVSRLKVARPGTRTLRQRRRSARPRRTSLNPIPSSAARNRGATSSSVSTSTRPGGVTHPKVIDEAARPLIARRAGGREAVEAKPKVIDGKTAP